MWTMVGIMIEFSLCLRVIVYVRGFSVASYLYLVCSYLFVFLAEQSCFFLLGEMYSWFYTRGTCGDRFYRRVGRNV